jgi:uncharacterized protein (UPF0216 family)
MQEQVYTVKATTNKTEWRNENGQLHRLDGPAIEWAYGDKYWFQEGQLHRMNGPAIEKADGSKYWYHEDQLHRLDGPAVEQANGTKHWYHEDQLHRLDGPAIERADGSKSWYIQGKELTEREFLTRTQPRELSLDEIAQKFGIPVELLKIKKG